SERAPEAAERAWFVGECAGDCRPVRRCETDGLAVLGPPGFSGPGGRNQRRADLAAGAGGEVGREVFAVAGGAADEEAQQAWRLGRSRDATSAAARTAGGGLSASGRPTTETTHGCTRRSR